MSTRQPWGKPKPTVLRRIGRDYPRVYELQLRVREKARIEAHRMGLKQLGPRGGNRIAQAADPPDHHVVIDALAGLGIQTGDVLMVHSSWETCRSLAAAPVDLIAILRGAVGTQGTICMPSYPAPWRVRMKGFDVRRSPSHAGLLTEVFRRSPGVVRSLQQRAVAAWGPAASELTEQHHLSPFPSDLSSPYGRLAALRGKVLFLGVGPENNTMFHCGEDVLKERFPVRVYESEPAEFQAIDADGRRLTVRNYERTARWTYCCDAVRMAPYFADLQVTGSIAGVTMTVVSADGFLDRLLSLAGVGVHMYGFRFPPVARTLREVVPIEACGLDV